MDLRTLYKHHIEGVAGKVDQTLNAQDNLQTSLRFPNDEHPEVDLYAGDFITSDTCLIFGGPPLQSQAMANKELVKVVGLCFSFTIQSNKRHSPWEELNVKDGGLIPGRLDHSIQISRVLSNHNNVLYAFYKWLTLLMLAKKNKVNSGQPIYASISTTAEPDRRLYVFEENPGYFTIRSSMAYNNYDASAYLTNKSADQYVTFSSEFFNAPFGIYVAELDGMNNVSAAYYCENCKILNYGKSYGESPVVAEAISIKAKRVIAAHKDLQLSLSPTGNTTSDKGSMINYTPYVQAINSGGSTSAPF